MNSHGLTHDQIKLIRDILLPFHQYIDQVCLFGSRATGKYRDNSDIDLVIFGQLSESMIDRLWTLFDNSYLALKVDVVGYNLIESPPLKSHIDKVAALLLSKQDFNDSAA
jgi:predicted nucleotidyltransferase